MKHRAYSKKMIVATIAATAILILGISMYLGRGWLRGPAISWLTTQMYAPKVDQVFERDVKPLNDHLATLGVSFDPAGPGMSPGDKAKCFDGNFRFVRETVYCGRWQTAYEHKLTPSLLAAWPEESKRIKQTLNDLGWTFGEHQNFTDYADGDDLAKLIDNTKPSVTIPYVKQNGKIDCTINFRYHQSYEGLPAAISIDEYCGRSVHFFGGYGYGR